MNPKLFFLLSLLATSSLQSAELIPDEAQQTWRENRLAWGKEVYGNYCAACHEPGASQAPAIRDRNAWNARSPLWSTVLFEHAKSGYLEMPSRGDHPELSDVAVDAAAEYMLSETYPELPVD